ncbi:MAG: hypothetical protein LJE88_15750 [Deltaproteobacteria bacterium]|jgi:hypothetical protein|nr:hypothetical protein [Deltaproteobacteria bacterium]
MAYIFLYQKWLHQRLHDYVTSPKPPQLRGRDVTLPTSQYGAALMQAYLGKASLRWVADLSCISLELLREWRQEPRFLLVMDWSKALFSRAFQEDLALNDYTLREYYHIAAEFSLLEESLRIAVRVPSYQRFKKLGRRLNSRRQNNLSLSKYDLRLFKRLFLFFLTLEEHWPSSAKKRINEDFLPLARDVVWPLLDEGTWVESPLEYLQQTEPMRHILHQLESRLSETLQTFS